MLNSFLNYLKSVSKKFAKENNIFDIIIYGSSVKSKENPNDTDFIIIFLNTKLEERSFIAQEFKELIKDKIKYPDIKTANLSELFNSNFLARQGILIEGYSLLSSVAFAEKLGFNGYSIFTYNLKNMNHNEKTKFTYSLIGRKNKGIIKLTNAEPLGKGAIAVPVEKSLIFEDFLKKWNISYKERKSLISKK